ncbi:MAG: efflux RND transporter periplasmic adaptor subunit [Planctomycetaceae bacterium]|nr:efflux RND transporter periplasmic adaptor subunit [Planctomycetaceae bacterium]
MAMIGTVRAWSGFVPIVNPNHDRAIMSHQFLLPGKSNIFRNLLQGLPTILALAVMASGWLLIHHLNSSEGTTEEEREPAIEVAQVDTIVLPAGKLKAGKFASEPVEFHFVQHQHAVPGRLRYEQTKHVDVKTPMDGILSELAVTPGDLVQAGQLIAVLRSPEIGQARAEVLKHTQQRAIAQKALDRENTLRANLKQLAVMLAASPPVDEIETSFKDRPLGRYRHEILSAYSNMLLADELIVKLRPLVESGAVPGRTLRERENERQLAETAFRTARDLAMFDVEQAQMKAAADVAESDRQLNLAWQSVETLLGYKENKETAHLADEEALSRLEVRAPFAGSVESRGFAQDERVMRGASLIVLANTDSLYVEASIRESDWSAVTLEPGTLIKVLVPALEDRIFDAEVCYFGREVQTETNSVPLVATIDNHDGLLRPGMFVRVTVPVGEKREVLAVRAESVIQHENQKFVFVDMSNGAFQRVDVSTGDASGDWVEITAGLSPGQKVVTQGAFLLKSEFLLQGEGE